jgi:hypothetical protein
LSSAERRYAVSVLSEGCELYALLKAMLGSEKCVDFYELKIRENHITTNFNDL